MWLQSQVIYNTSITNITKMRTYKFQLKPNKLQEKLLFDTLNNCRFTYNKLLEKLNSLEKIDRGVVQHYIVELKHQYPQLKNVI